MSYRSGITEASIVIGANNHNPTIASIEWLKEKDVVSESPENFSHSPAFSYVVTKNYQLVIEPERLKMSVRVVNERNINKLPLNVINYVNGLPETPYESVMIQFLWTIYSDDKLIGHEFIAKNLINSDASFVKAMENKSSVIYEGMVIYKITDDYGLSLNIEPILTSPNDILLNFSYQFKVSNGKNHDNVTKTLESYPQILENAKETVDNFTRFAST